MREGLDGADGSAVEEAGAAGPGSGEGAGPGLTVTAVARRLGVAPATLRSWHRRYGIGPSAHREGRHRRYTAADVERLERMRAALLRGASTADAAGAALAGAPAARPPAGPPSRIGGRGLRLPGADALARRLGRAVLGMDASAVRVVLDEAVGSLGVVPTWDDVARPVLVALADRWASTGRGVEAEHLLSECLIRALDAAGGPTGRVARPVVLACVPEERHGLPLCALAAALAECGVAAQMLGAALPSEALHAAVRRMAPAAVVLWAHAPVTDPVVSALDLRPRTRPPSRWFAAGPGWTDRPLPAGVTALESLAQATDTIAHAVRIDGQHRP